MQFSTDLDQVQMSTDSYKMSEAEILIKFFKFYGHTFNEEKLAIDIRSGC